MADDIRASTHYPVRVQHGTVVDLFIFQPIGTNDTKYGCPVGGDDTAV